MVRSICKQIFQKRIRTIVKTVPSKMSMFEPIITHDNSDHMLLLIFP